jgi:amino acid transporter
MPPGHWERPAAYIAGLAQVIEFVFAPPAIAAAIGAYFHLFLPSLPVMAISITAYIVFTALNIYGVKRPRCSNWPLPFWQWVSFCFLQVLPCHILKWKT